MPATRPMCRGWSPWWGGIPSAPSWSGSSSFTGSATSRSSISPATSTWCSPSAATMSPRTASGWRCGSTPSSSSTRRGRSVPGGSTGTWALSSSSWEFPPGRCPATWSKPAEPAAIDSRERGTKVSHPTNSIAIDLAEFKQGWRFIILALVGVATSSAVMPLYGFGAMVVPLEEALGFRRSDLLATITFSSFGAVFSSQLAGVLNRRYGIKPVTVASLIGLPLMFVVMSQVDRLGGSIWILYGLFFLVTFAGVGTLQVTWTQVVNPWFDKNRRLALAMTRSGSGVAGLTLPSLVTSAVELWGWRAGFLAMALLPLLVTLPLALMWLSSSERRPSSHGPS